MRHQETYLQHVTPSYFCQATFNNKEAIFVARKFLLNQGADIKQISLMSDFFYVPPKEEYYGKYVLLPKDDDYSEIHKYIICTVNQFEACEVNLDN